MTEGNSPNLELRSDVREAGGLRAFQFGLSSLFVVVTVAALILSTYFGVGKLVGMSTMEVLTQGFGTEVFNAPIFLVWIVGLMMAIRRLKRNRLPAILTIIVIGGVVLTTFISGVVRMALIHSVISNQISQEAFARNSAFISVLETVIHTVWWILIIVAIFVRRPPDAPQPERSDSVGDPFLPNES